MCPLPITYMSHEGMQSSHWHKFSHMPLKFTRKNCYSKGILNKLRSTSSTSKKAFSALDTCWIATHTGRTKLHFEPMLPGTWIVAVREHGTGTQYVISCGMWYARGRLLRIAWLERNTFIRSVKRCFGPSLSQSLINL